VLLREQRCCWLQSERAEVLLAAGAGRRVGLHAEVCISVSPVYISVSSELCAWRMRVGAALRMLRLTCVLW
jgi:hypothetical protein